VIKRSVSPDGRIDSLSVEFSHSLNGESVGQIKEKAIKTLQLNSMIVDAFLTARKPKEAEARSAALKDSEETIPATMLDIGGMNGKWGRRLFINVQANGNRLKLFGSKQQLSRFITDAGVWNTPEEISEGIRLNLPCRIDTKPSSDGRFLDIVRVLPVNIPSPERRTG
jgi:hypothetical protein